MAEEKGIMSESDLPEIDQQLLGTIIGPMIASMIVRTPANHGGDAADVFMLLENVMMCVIMSLIEPKSFAEVADKIGERLKNRLLSVQDDVEQLEALRGDVFTRH